MKKIHDHLMKKMPSYSRWHTHPRRNFHHFAIFVVITIVSAISLITSINNFSYAEDFDSVDDQAYQKTNLSESTKDILELQYQLKGAKDTDKASVLGKLVASAKARTKAMLVTMQSNPNVVLNNSINPSVRANMPDEIKNLIEEKKTIKGKFSHIHMDYFDENRVVNNYFIDDGSKRYQVHLTKGSPKAKTGDTVTITGIALENNLVANTEDVTVLSTQPVAAAVSKKSAVILFNWQNDNRTTFTQDSARQAFFTGTNSANSYFKENSFGKMELVGKTRTDGDVFGWYTIPYDNVDCANNWNVWASAANTKAREAGVDLTGYDTITYVFPGVSCGWSGLGYIGGNPATSWINGTSVGVITHELGHNIGTHHASSLNCTENGARVSISNTCSMSEYGDPFDVMGSAGGMKHMNNYHKGQTGTYAPNWLASSNTQTIDRAISPDGTYTISPIETSSASVQSLRIPKTYTSTGTVSEYYYVEFRQPFGFDNFSPSDPVVNGVMIRVAPNYNSTTQSKLIDATPDTSTFSDAALPVGSTFTDNNNAISITTLSVSPTSASVKVSFGPLPCVSYAPTVSISPTNQTGAAGQTLAYNVTVKNNDMPECAPTNFSVTPTLPAGFIQSPASITSDMVAPGASFTSSVNITSPSTATNGNVSISEKATNLTSSLSSTASAVYSVTAPDTKAPIVSITKPANGSRVPTKGSLSISATASDDRGVKTIEIYIDTRIIKTCNNTTSCSVNAKVNSITTGAHTITAKAIDASGNSASASVSVTK